MTVHFRHCFNYDHVTQLDRDDAGWDTTPISIGPTKFKGSFELLGNHDLHIAVVKITGNYIVHTTPPPNTIQLSINLPTKNHRISWMGHELDIPSITISKNTNKYHGFINGSMHAIIIEIPLDNPHSPNALLANNMQPFGDLLSAKIPHECIQKLIYFLEFWSSSISNKDVNSIAQSSFDEIPNAIQQIFHSIIPKTAVYHEQIDHCDLINKSIHYIESQIDNGDLSVSKIANHCEISSRYLQIIFKKLFGINPLHYIKCRRITNVMKVLSNKKSHSSIREAAERNGISHLGRFASDFKLLTGYTPSEWKRLEHQPTQVHAEELVV